MGRQIEGIIQEDLTPHYKEEGIEYACVYV